MNISKSYKIGFLANIFFIICLLPFSSFGQGYQIKDPNKRNIRGNSKVNAFNVKVMPALYLNTIGMEIEYPATKHITIGVNALGKSARTDLGGSNVFKIRPEKVQDASWKIELAIKFYFPYDLFKESKKIGYNAPVGLYLQGNASFGNLFYYDGTNRPFTMHSKWKKFGASFRETSELSAPQPFSLGGGLGYQAIVVPQHIIANIMFGTQLYFNNKTFTPYLGIYVAPSIGYVF